MRANEQCCWLQYRPPAAAIARMAGSYNCFLTSDCEHMAATSTELE